MEDEDGSITFQQPNANITSSSKGTNLEYEERHVTQARYEFEKEYLEKARFHEKI